MPDEERSWTLEKKQAGASRKSEGESVNLEQCPKCYAVFTPPENQPTVCPYCGFEFPVKERKLAVKADAELKKIDGFKLDFSSPAECKSYSELLAYAKKCGYKPGWAYFRAKERGLI